MEVTIEALNSIRMGFNLIFKETLDKTEVLYNRIASTVSSTTREEYYAWLQAIPGMREWIGDRVIKSVGEAGYSIVNKTWEDTIGVKRESIEDDNLGIYTPLIQGMAAAAKTNPDYLVFSLLAAGFETACHDGQYFFDSDHPDGQGSTWSNTGGGSGTPWFLLAVNNPMKPLVFQNRRAITFTALDQPTDDNVFMRSEFVYGCDARYNVGYGFPELAYGSKQDLDATNFKAARLAMRTRKNEEGRPMNVFGGSKPLLVVPPSLEDDADELINKARLASGEDNSLLGAAEILVSDWLS